MEILECEHISHQSKNYCVLCGGYILKSLTSAIKTVRYSDPQPSFLEKQFPLIKSKLKSIPNRFSIFLPRDAVLKMTQILQYQNWSALTQAKGIYFYSQYVKQYPKLNSGQQLKYVLMCVFLAAKFQEHTNYKSLKKFRRDCERCFELEQFYELESVILAKINFDFNIISFVNLLEYYLVRGVTFSNQRINPKKVEDKMTILAKSYIRDGTFLKCQQQKLAVFILYKVRLDMQCSEVWNWAIEDYTGVSLENVKNAFEEIRDILLGVPKIKQNRKSLLEVLTPSTPRRILVELQNYIC